MKTSDTKFQAIPEGYMRVGEMAKKAGVTVRTLQYYDKEGILSPSAESEGGFRLYTDKDMVALIRIFMMKELGFSLKDIKKRLTSMDTTADVMKILTEQTAHIRAKIEALTESLVEIEALKKEIALMETVDFKKYAAILMNLQIKNENYWMIKHFDNEVLDKLADGMEKEQATMVVETVNRLFEEAHMLHAAGEHPEGAKGQKVAKEFWDAMLIITGGDMELVQKINSHAEKFSASNEGKSQKFIEKTMFMAPALEHYLDNLNEGETI